MKSSRSGQSLFEVVVAIALISIVMITIVSLVTTSTRNSVYSRNKTEANRYAQEGIEWVRGERDVQGYQLFEILAGTTPRCLDTLIWRSASPCPTIPTTIFTREIFFTPVDDGVKTAVSVTWTDGQGDHVVTEETILSDWRVRPTPP